MQLHNNLFLALVLCLGFVACSSGTKTEPKNTPEPAQTTTNKPDSKAAADPVKPAASCKNGEPPRCEGNYAGKVQEGNNAPAGAQVMICKDGVWTLQETCDSAKNLGCYQMEEPSTGEQVARCLSTFSPGE